MTDTFSDRLRKGEKLYGTLIVSPSPRWPEQFAKIGLDFVFIDTEHIALDRAELSWTDLARIVQCGHHSGRYRPEDRPDRTGLEVGHADVSDDV